MRLLSVRLVFLCMLIPALSGCGSDNINNSSESSDKTLIRVHNLSAYDFVNIVVDDHNYGAVAAGAFSDYADLGVAYRYNYVKLTAAGAVFTLQPIDYVGETAFAAGKFSYEIDITDFAARALSIEAVEDK